MVLTSLHIRARLSIKCLFDAYVFVGARPGQVFLQSSIIRLVQSDGKKALCRKSFL